MTRNADFKRRVRERMARTGESYEAAGTQLLPRGTLHVTNGDSMVALLEKTGLAERILAWRDVLHEGPVPAVPDAERRRLRAEFLAGADHPDVAAIVRDLEARDRTLDRHAGEYVLWFEADLYDQLQIAEILARLAARRVDPGRITLISVGEHVGIPHFGGLGELGPEQLAALAERAATPVGPAALELATRAWNALRAPGPRGVAELTTVHSSELRFLAEAFGRLAREYPSRRDGLSLTERRLLAGAADGGAGGPVSRVALFDQAGRKEPRPFLGDTFAFRILDRLAGAPHPLLRPEADGRLALTADGERVLAGEADHVTLNGIDRWIGGVHLSGREVPWRWDEATETLV
jgi:hypothetical protein